VLQKGSKNLKLTDPPFILFRFEDVVLLISNVQYTICYKVYLLPSTLQQSMTINADPGPDTLEQNFLLGPAVFGSVVLCSECNSLFIGKLLSMYSSSSNNK
jgi:hypothetical protein